MELHQLRSFYYVATYLNFSRAAEKLLVSQPAVSRQIEALERLYGLPLFYRSKKKVELTPAGRELLTYAKKMMTLAEDAKEALLTLKNGDSGELHVGCGTTIGNFAITALVVHFQKKYPNIHIHLDIDNTDTIINKLNERKLDVAIIAKDVDREAFNVDSLFQDNIHLVCLAEEMQKYKQSQSLDQLENETYILRKRGSHTRECVDEYFKTMNFQPQNIIEVNNNEAIKQAVIQKLGVGFLSSITYKIEREHQILRQIRLQKPSKREFSFIYPKGKYYSTVMEMFHTFLKDNMSKIT
ncbi:LysR family transcriptional regulator [Evansella cellulosilytica]|uniref:Transcriptional regulator, LysR family n=1 Tax=Evansella cellulosilytica (strain ATCC 21833 / DSM 2522 / FERM P-1141 / JCM 9156 / N-4) TaxID=649639 RepID=E6TU72_EVAC2|nr:LysR family transcriptional regulator [Evansella cellulosilytica]ADU28532.1 transcriptional regulator, LysR family [Evansella cellulosilytica DSM 2522]